MDELVFSAEFWQVNQGAFLGLIAILALVIGSFLNVVILRLPVMMDQGWRRECRQMLDAEPIRIGAIDGPVSLLFPPSTCPACGHRIRAWENVPVLSFALQRGRCAACRARIPLRYPLIELLAALVALIVAWRFGVSWLTAAALGLSWALLVLAVIDIDHQLLPDSITLPLVWAGLLANSQALLVPLHDALWGAVAGYLVLWFVFWAFKLLTGKDGMGYGDFKLLAALGAWLGWQALPLIIIVSSFLGAVVGICLIVLRGRDRNVPIPFGPYLAAAGWIALLWGDSAVAFWYRYVLVA